MSKVTSKLQVTRAIADRFGIRPGDELERDPAGDVIRVLPKSTAPVVDPHERLRAFDAATERQAEREAQASHHEATDLDRGWTRKELYERGSAR